MCSWLSRPTQGYLILKSICPIDHQGKFHFRHLKLTSRSLVRRLKNLKRTLRLAKEAFKLQIKAVITAQLQEARQNRLVNLHQGWPRTIQSSNLLVRPISVKRNWPQMNLKMELSQLSSLCEIIWTSKPYRWQTLKTSIWAERITDNPKIAQGFLRFRITTQEVQTSSTLIFHSIIPRRRKNGAAKGLAQIPSSNQGGRFMSKIVLWWMITKKTLAVKNGWWTSNQL